ncbi:MAG: glycine dehydrogenase subunit 2 [Cyanobacteria bacterium SIG30]|nr:glycine dehydrogenase subunit 2 [Cyanobacteria bacterium SIG30]
MKRKTPLNFKNNEELEVMRKYKKRSDENFCIEKGFYPLGSCTMKYNPRINEYCANLEKLLNIHPSQKDEEVQGALEIMYKLQESLKEITGMSGVSLQPCAGAHGELTGMMIIKKYFEKKGEERKKVIVPDSAHGTNPMSAAMCGYEIIQIKSNEKGLVNIEELKKVLDKNVAGLMLTNPNTLGLFEEEILEISKIMHENGSLLYYDGANFNAIMGHTNPKKMGFDVVHLNLHKTFSTPHGGGGPGAGPVCVIEELKDYLPNPIVEFDGEKYYRNYKIKNSIGKVSTFFGNFSVLIRAYTYILSYGNQLRNVSSKAVLNANYIMENLRNEFDIANSGKCMHEFVICGEKQKEKGVSTLQMAKRLMDFDIHPPTIYFPLIIHESMMIEPTESENKETLDNFINVMKEIAKEVDENPVNFENYPSKTPIKKADETLAARNLNLRN